MKISISGPSSSGKSSLAKALGECFGLEVYSAGTIFREVAQKRGIKLEELSKLAEEELDKIVDERTKFICQTKDNFIIEGRLAIYFCPNSFKIFLTALKEKRAERLAIRENLDFSKALELLEKRDKNDFERYKKLYGIENYEEEFKKIADVVIESTFMSLEETIKFAQNKILEFFKKNNF